MKKYLIFLSVGLIISISPVISFNFSSSATGQPRFSSPALVTSAGQNAEVQMVAVLAKRAGIDYTLEKLATAENLKGMKSLLLVLGTSMKGLGAAGLDTSKEMQRVKGLVEAARAQNIPILCLHLGGEERRGPLSDEFITTFLPSAQMAIVVRAGNKDGLFSKICQQQGIDLVEVDKAVDALEPLKNAFIGS